MMPRNLVNRYKRFQRTCFLCLTPAYKYFFETLPGIFRTTRRLITETYYVKHCMFLFSIACCGGSIVDISEILTVLLSLIRFGKPDCLVDFDSFVPYEITCKDWAFYLQRQHSYKVRFSILLFLQWAVTFLLQQRNPTFLATWDTWIEYLSS